MEENAQPTQQQVELSANEEKLQTVLARLNTAIAGRNKLEEKTAYTEAQTLYKSITGDDLSEKASEATLAEIQFEGTSTIPKNSIAAIENFNNEMEGFKFKQQNSAAQKAWAFISEEEKKQFGGDVNSFISQMEKKAQEMKKGGLNISKEIFFNMVASGYMLFNAKDDMFRERVRIPVLIATGAYKYKKIFKKDFADFLVVMQQLVDLTGRQAIEEKLGKKAQESKNRWHKRKMRKVRELLAGLVEKIGMERDAESGKSKMMKTIEEEVRGRIQKEVEAETREALEKISHIGGVGVLKRLKDFEALEKETDKNIKRDIKKVQESLEKDIKERAKEEKKIAKIMKKQIKKGKISQKRIAYVDSAVPESPAPPPPPAAN